jgi:hypothetical protein
VYGASTTLLTESGNEDPLAHRNHSVADCFMSFVIANLNDMNRHLCDTQIFSVYINLQFQHHCLFLPKHLSNSSQYTFNDYRLSRISSLYFEPATLHFLHEILKSSITFVGVIMCYMLVHIILYY